MVAHLVLPLGLVLRVVALILAGHDETTCDESTSTQLDVLLPPRASRCSGLCSEHDSVSSRRMAKKFAVATGEPEPAAGAYAEPSSPSTDEPLFVAACHVLLQDEHDPNYPSSPWLESTKPLSLVCLQLCIECRAVSKFHVLVTNDTPKILWSVLANGDRTSTSSIATASRASRSHYTQIRGTSRVPAVKVTRLTWERTDPVNGGSSAVPTTLPLGVKTLVFGNRYNVPVDDFAWPKELEVLRFGAAFNQSIDEASFPDTIREIAFGRSFDQVIDRVTWPRALTRIKFGQSFDQAIMMTDNRWPSGVVELVFGDGFNQPLDSIVWPPNLEKLTFGREFNQDIRGISWPSRMKELTFGWLFEHPLQGVKFPMSLDHLALVGVFDHPLVDVALPMGLKKLTLGGHFNQPLESVTLPESLEELVFGWSFNHSLLRVAWPTGLKRLTLGYRFKQPAECFRLPKNLQALELGVFSRQPLANVVWPTSFKLLTVSRAFDLSGAMLPKGSRVCRLGHTYCDVKRGVKHWYYHRVIASGHVGT